MLLFMRLSTLKTHLISDVLVISYEHRTFMSFSNISEGCFIKSRDTLDSDFRKNLNK